MTPTLSTLTLDQIPALTDDECDALYAELAPHTQVGRVVDSGGRVIGTFPLEFPKPVCNPDCPASVLEGLPALVERMTGYQAQMEIIWSRDGHVILPSVKPLDNDANARVLDGRQRYTFRHLAHACFCATFAACVVLRRATHEINGSR